MTAHRFLIFFLAAFFTNEGYSQLNSYKNYNGAIDGDSITMYLCNWGHEYFGFYYYNHNEIPIFLTGQDTSETKDIQLTCFTPGPGGQENFAIQKKNNSVSGKWQAGTDSVPHNFSAIENVLASHFDLVGTKGSVLLDSSMANSPIASFEAVSVWPRENSMGASFLKKSIDETWGQKNSMSNPGSLFRHMEKRYFTEYLDQNKALKKSNINDSNSYAYSADQRDELMIVFEARNLVSLAKFSYSYTGGAHGNYGTSFTSIDVANGKKLTITDVMNAKGQKQLPGLLSKYFRKSYSLKETDSLTAAGLFANNIAPTHNFFVTGKGIGFNYQPYEIGPFALGEITIFIPFSEVETNLQPGFKKLIE